MLSLGLSLGSVIYGEHDHAHHGELESGVSMDKMAKELNLTEDQKEQIKKIMEEKKQKMMEIMTSTQEKVKGVLTEEQKKKFESFHSKRQGHMHKDGEQCNMGCCSDKK